MKLYYIDRVEGQGCSSHGLIIRVIETEEQKKEILEKIAAHNKDCTYAWQHMKVSENVDSDTESTFAEEEINNPYDVYLDEGDKVDEIMMVFLDEAITAKFGIEALNESDNMVDDSQSFKSWELKEDINAMMLDRETIVRMRARFIKQHGIKYRNVFKNLNTKYDRDFVTRNSFKLIEKNYTDNPEFLYVVRVIDEDGGCGCFSIKNYVGIYKDIEKAQNMVKKCNNYGNKSTIAYNLDSSVGNSVNVSLVKLVYDPQQNVYHTAK